MLNGLDFCAEPGSFLALLGPSGSGKSVTLNILSGLMAPTAGTVRFEDADGQTRAGRATKIGYVFQSPRLLPWKTVADNVAFVLDRRAGRDEIARRVARVLDLVGIREFADYYPHQVSGGMQQRAAIARALVYEPDVVLMDEPFSHLDEITARGLRAEIVSLWRQMGMTILFVTHDITEACFLSQRVVLLTPKPTRVFREIDVPLPYPRVYASDALFEQEKRVLRTFEESIAEHQLAPRAAVTGSPI